MTFITRFLSLTLFLAGIILSGMAFAATDGFGNDNFKGSYFDNQAPAALADDSGAALNGITPAAGDAAKTGTAAVQTGPTSAAQNPQNPVQAEAHSAPDTNGAVEVSGHSP